MAGSVALPGSRALRAASLTGVAAVGCFAVALAGAVSTEGIRGAQARPCDPSSAMAPVILLSPELSHAPLNPRFQPVGCVVVSGFWVQDQGGTAALRIVSDGAASLAVDGRVVVVHSARPSERAANGRTALDPGAHSFEITFEPQGPSQLKVLVVDERGARVLDPTFLRPPSKAEYLTERARRVLLRAAALLLAVALLALLLSPGALKPALAVLAFAFLLRFEALTGRYAEARPGAVAQSLFAVAHDLRPDSWTWEKEITPYAGRDPVNYIRFAKQMRGFFDAHVREPLFVAWSRLFIVNLRFADVGISIASMLASCLLVGATVLFARARFGRPVALIAGVLLAADTSEISLSVEGWRDGAFAAFFVMGLWALHRVRVAPTPRNGAVAGAILGLSCLLRLSGLSFVAAALVDLAVSGSAPRRQRLKVAAAALVVSALLVGPYLASCAAAFGDPLYAVNYHLRYYRPDGGGATSATQAYLFSSADPLGRADTLFEGLTSYPFLSKWKGLEVWLGPLSDGVMAASALGLLGWAVSGPGLRILVLTASALLPFAFTWMVQGGAEYRFTLFAYPVYLIAASWWIERVVALLRGALPIRQAAIEAGKVLALSAALVLFGFGLRTARVEADGRAGRAFTINAGPRDWPQARGFGMPRRADEGFVRASADSRRFLRVSLPPGRAWTLTLRWRCSLGGEVREDGRLIDNLPPTSGDEAGERTMRLPPSPSTDRVFEITSAAALEFWSARLAPAPAGT